MSTERKNNYRRLRIIDKIPESEWCDVRVEYIKDGKTVAEIAEERRCGERTISRLIKENRSFSSIGRKRTPSKIDGYQITIEDLLRGAEFKDVSQVMLLSKALYEIICPLGYEGSERTLRDYLQTIPWMDWVAGDWPGNCK